MEELGEFVSANFGLESYKKATPEDIQEEVVDVLQCAIGLYALVQEAYPFAGEAIMNAELDKWSAKYLK